jgi:hypothetical protein
MAAPILDNYDTTYPLEKTILNFFQSQNRPLKLLILNTGGTFSCLPNKDGKLAPIETEKLLGEMIASGMHLKDFVDRGLLEIDILHYSNIDSSQMRPHQRDGLISKIKSQYLDYDGMIMFHGTDTGAHTGKYFELAMPYYNPEKIWNAYLDNDLDTKIQNWSKGFGIVSAQRSSVKLDIEGQLIPRLGSDGPQNLATAIATLADIQLGGVFLTNNDAAILGSDAVKKNAELIPPYEIDSQALPLVMYGTDLHYSPYGIPQHHAQSGMFSPLVIENASKYERAVMPVQRTQNLEILRLFNDYHKMNQTRRAKDMKPFLPKIIIYEVTGEGHMLGDDDVDVIKKAKENGLEVDLFRVPILGSRIPPAGHYDAPGFEYPELNMLMDTAIYKGMMTLALADQLKISYNNPAKDSKYSNQREEFIHVMMKRHWGNEFLPKTT